MNAVPAAVMDHVDFSYDGAPVLQDASMRVARADFVGVVGPNGGGKTTLLRLLLGLLRPNRGTVQVLGQAPAAARHRVGYVAQSSRHDLLFPITVAEVVLTGRLGTGPLVGPYRAQDRRLALEALDRVGLADLARRRFGALSGGQQQRALIARALASDAELLMLDEPTTSLDAAAEASLYALLEELNRDLTIILVTHDAAFVARCIRTVFCVNRKVVRHAISDLDETDGALLKVMYGADVRLVRHDTDCTGADCRE